MLTAESTKHASTGVHCTFIEAWSSGKHRISGKPLDFGHQGYKPLVLCTGFVARLFCLCGQWSLKLSNPGPENTTWSRRRRGCSAPSQKPGPTRSHFNKFGLVNEFPSLVESRQGPLNLRPIAIDEECGVVLPCMAALLNPESLSTLTLPSKRLHLGHQAPTKSTQGRKSVHCSKLI